MNDDFREKRSHIAILNGWAVKDRVTPKVRRVGGDLVLQVQEGRVNKQINKPFAIDFTVWGPLALFYSIIDGTRLSLNKVCELEDLLSVCHPVGAMATGSWPASRLIVPAFTRQSCWSAQYQGIPVPPHHPLMAGFLWGSHGGGAPRPGGVTAPSRVAPLCLFAAALIQHRSLPAAQQVRDLVTRLFAGRLSVIAMVIGSCYHNHTGRCGALDWPEEGKQWIMGWDMA